MRPFLMDQTLNRQLQRFWWVPLLLLFTQRILPTLLYRLPLFQSHSGVGVLDWIAPGLLLACGTGLVFFAWRSLGSAFRVLTVAQLAMQGSHLVLTRAVLDPMIYRNRGVYGLAAWVGYWNLEWVLLYAAVLSTAFWLGRREGEDSSLGVTVSAVLAVLGGGWAFVGLTPLLAMLWKNVLPFELCGGAESPDRAAVRAALAGFVTLVFIPLTVLGPFAFWMLWIIPNSDLWTMIALLAGVLAWVRMSAKWGRAGHALRTLNYTGMGFLLAIWLALRFLPLPFTGGGVGP